MSAHALRVSSASTSADARPPSIDRMIGPCTYSTGTPELPRSVCPATPLDDLPAARRLPIGETDDLTSPVGRNSGIVPRYPGGLAP